MNRVLKAITRSYNGQLLDVAAASELLGCSERALRARIARRLIPYRRFSGRIVFVRSELEAFLMNLPGCSVKEARHNLGMRSSELVVR